MSRLFVRHAQSYANQTGVLAPEFLGSDLSQFGHQQAESTATFLRSHVSGHVVITSSPHLRCIQTAQHIAASLDAGRIDIEEAIGVRFLGSALGKDRDYRRIFPTYDEIPDSESTKDFLRRIFPYAHNQDDKHWQNHATEIVVTHSGVISAIKYLTAKHVPFGEIPLLENDCYRADYNKFTVPNASVWMHRGEDISMLYPDTTA